MKLDKLRTMISKWVVESKLNDMEIGSQIRKYYWREIHSYEHWMNDSEYEEGGDLMMGGSSIYDDGEDEIY